MTKVNLDAIDKITYLSSSNTHNEIPSAKAVYDLVEGLEEELQTI